MNSHSLAQFAAVPQRAFCLPAGAALAIFPVVRPWGLQPQPRQLRPVATSAAAQEDPDKASPTQDQLVSMLRLEIGKKEVDDFVEESGEKLRAVADEAKEEMERMAEVARLRSEVAFNSALADINAEADAFEAELRASREAAEASERDFEAWEAGVAANRSEGQFFQTLYQDDKKRPLGASAEQLRERAAKVAEPAKTELSSSLRVNLFFVLAFLMAAQVGADLASADPSPGPDLLYTALAALAVWLALNERKGLP